MKYILLVFLNLALSGCAVGGMPNGDKDYGWYLQHRIFTDEKVFYCKANKSEKGAAPQCFEAEMKDLKQ